MARESYQKYAEWEIQEEIDRAIYKEIRKKDNSPWKKDTEKWILENKDKYDSIAAETRKRCLEFNKDRDRVSEELKKIRNIKSKLTEEEMSILRNYAASGNYNERRYFFNALSGDFDYLII